MLSKEEAVAFTTEVLKIPSSHVKDGTIRDERSCSFLTELIRAFQATIPFQSITLNSEKRHRHTWEEVKADVFSTRGGRCYTLNVFIKCLLETFGYNVHLVSSSVGGIPNNHILMFVNNLKENGDRYLVDVGMACPTFEPVPIDFMKESPVYTQSFLEYKFGWEDRKLVRLHYKGERTRPVVPGEVVVDGWRKICYIDPTPRDLAFFDKLMDQIYSDPTSMVTPYDHTLRVIDPGLRAIIIKDKTLLIENDSNGLVEQKLNSAEEVLAKIKDLFPVLYGEAERALKNLKL